MRFHLLSGLLLACLATLAPAEERPNILWFVVDDMSPNLGCHGEKAIQTPNLDRLAAEGTRFSHAYTTAPVCSPCRSALITGMYQTSIGAQNHRSGRALPIVLPAGVRPIPELFRQAGYHTCIGNGMAGNQSRGKTDYNFTWDQAMYHGADWADRKPGQPFFMQVQLPGGKLRDGNGWIGLEKRLGQRATNPETVLLPPYYPRDKVLLKDWALYLDSVCETDEAVGRVIARLKKEQLLDNTLVIFCTDHGISHARGKQFLYDEGTHVPLIIRGPGIRPGLVRPDLVELIDLAPVSLAAAGLPKPHGMQGRDILAADYKVRDAVFAARDRCDETVDRIRSMRTDEWLYLRNFHPDRPMLQPCRYKDDKPTLKRLRELHASKQLPALATRLLFSSGRPPEELYQWKKDPWQIQDLAGDPAHAGVLARLRRSLDQWMEQTGDQGRQPEAPAGYDAEMKVYLKDLQGQDTGGLKANIATMKRWAAAGK